jgi:thiosulfate reductase cytochrome b subunit
VRITHWLTTLAFFALLLSGVELIISHPRFYWGETGNVNMKPLFIIHIPSSRETVPTGYPTLPDQNGWSRYLHFEAAWLLVLTAAVYGLWSLRSGHFRRVLLPEKVQRTPRAITEVLRSYRRGTKPGGTGYNPIQRLTYISVVFILVPAMIWTGLALSPAFDSAFPFVVNVLGGRQSARTLHFFITGALVLFVIVHVAMVIHAGFRSQLRAMTLGTPTPEEETA